METSLHRELKLLYAGRQAQFEVPVDGYRADAIVRGRVIEIQHGPLGAIRDKIRTLLADHRVTVVKPIVASKLLVKQSDKGGEVLSRRLSPKRGRLLDLFHDLVHFTNVFPHPRLTLEVLLVDVEEWRYPGHGRRRRWRTSDHQVEDQRLVNILQKHRLRTIADLASLVDVPLTEPFDTGDLAQGLDVPRWIGQRIAYCLHQMGAFEQTGKQGNARLYRWTNRRWRKSAAGA
jgi:hypothetical protein